jgi:hypothetical protein
LKRLERRGLIMRCNFFTGESVEQHDRTDTLIFTDAGRSEAERLSVNNLKG